MVTFTADLAEKLEAAQEQVEGISAKLVLHLAAIQVRAGRGEAKWALISEELVDMPRKVRVAQAKRDAAEVMRLLRREEALGIAFQLFEDSADAARHA